MARQRALKNRVDYRAGGYVARKGYVTGTTVVTAPGINLDKMRKDDSVETKVEITGGKPVAKDVAELRETLGADVSQTGLEDTVTPGSQIQQLKARKALERPKAVTPDTAQTTKAHAGTLT